MRISRTGQSWLQRIRRQVEPEGLLGEEPQPDRDDDQPEDDRRPVRPRSSRRRAYRWPGPLGAGTAVHAGHRPDGGWRQMAAGIGARVVGDGSVGPVGDVGHRIVRRRSLVAPAGRGACGGRSRRGRRSLARHTCQWASGRSGPRQDGGVTRGGHGGDRRLRRLGLLLAARRRARGQGRHAVRPAVRLALPGRRRRADASRSCRATAGATRSRRTGSTTGPTSGR